MTLERPTNWWWATLALVASSSIAEPAPSASTKDLEQSSMWVDCVKRAYEGGLRVMVALAVNSVTLATGFEGTPPYDDKTSGDTQIAELVRW